MTRMLCVLLCFFLCLPIFPAEAQEQPFTIIGTIFPAFDLARSLAGSVANVSMLLPPGSESHSFEPTPQDIVAIQQADLFIYVGSESDHWIEDILLSMGDQAPVSFRLMDCVALLAEETTASMQHDHDHAHDEHCAHEADYSEMDEHVWTSPRNVMHIAETLTATLCELAPEHHEFFKSLLADYLAELKALDQAFVDTVASGKRRQIIFGDRFPFRYFAAEYGLEYDAAFPGCSEDSEPSVRTVISLIDKVREESIPVIFYIEFSSRRTADILAEETNAKPQLFHSCHNVSAEEIENGATYLNLMWRNVDALKEALN